METYTAEAQRRAKAFNEKYLAQDISIIIDCYANGTMFKAVLMHGNEVIDVINAVTSIYDSFDDEFKAEQEVYEKVCMWERMAEHMIPATDKKQMQMMREAFDHISKAWMLLYDANAGDKLLSKIMSIEAELIELGVDDEEVV